MRNLYKTKYSIAPEQVIDVIHNTIKISLEQKRIYKHKDEYEWYNHFLTNITSKNSGIITSNWDTVPEELSTLFNKGISINYMNGSENGKTILNSKLDIIKLRGSLNWHEINVENSKNIYLSTPTIIPPGLFKSESSLRKFLELWKKARIWLRKCKIVYFIGYSFKDNDINALISGSLEENKDIEEIIIIDMKCNDDRTKLEKLDFEKRYSHIIFDNSKIKAYYQGFENYWKENKYLKDCG
jgi:hypothetical protein